MSDTDYAYEPADVRMNANMAAKCIVALLKDDQTISATQIIRGWCGCNLRTAVNMMRAFRDMGGSTHDRVAKIEASLPLGRMAEVI